MKVESKRVCEKARAYRNRDRQGAAFFPTGIVCRSPLPDGRGSERPSHTPSTELDGRKGLKR